MTLISDITIRVIGALWELFKTMADIIGMLIFVAVMMAMIAVPTIMALQ